MTQITEITSETFDREVLASETPVVVEFYAPHCEQCEAIETKLDRLARKFAERIRFVRVDVDAEPLLAARHLIEAVPTLMLFKAGTDVDDDVDFLTPGAIESELERVAGGFHSACMWP